MFARNTPPPPTGRLRLTGWPMPARRVSCEGGGVSLPLPAFRYHPDPLASGSFTARAGACRCCERDRGVLYTGPVYAEEELDDALCPWCIADGTAHAKFGATFFDAEALGDVIPAPVADEICRRTPGYSAWQQGRWPGCCGDATAFLAAVGREDLRARFHEYEAPVLSHIIYEMQISGGAARRLLDSLDRDAGPTAYLFRCLRCARPHVHLDYL